MKLEYTFFSLQSFLSEKGVFLPFGSTLGIKRCSGKVFSLFPAER